MRSKMKNDLLNSLIYILINGPPANNKEADQLLERAFKLKQMKSTRKYQLKKN